MYQNPTTQLQLARQIEAERQAKWLIQIDPQPVESVLDSIVRRLKQLIGTRPLQPLARGAS
jgi:hypothetical protein